MNTIVRTNVAAEFALRMLVATEMRAFTRDDWLGFAGCESKHPLIGTFANNYTLVLDGETLLVLENGDEYGGQLFTLKGEQT